MSDEIRYLITFLTCILGGLVFVFIVLPYIRFILDTLCSKGKQRRGVLSYILGGNSMSNGCGIFGIYSGIYLKIKGKLPPIQYACDEHDNEYEEVKTKDDRLKADVSFKNKIIDAGYPITAKIFYFLVRAFGWLAILKRNHERYFKKV